MYYIGRIIGAFFNQFFRWLFWNKTGQKFLFSILIVFIFFCFIKLGEVSAVEEVSDVNYEVYSYYENVTNHAISLLGRLYLNGEFQSLFNAIKSNSQNYNYYFYYGNVDGSSYANAEPINKTYINILEYAQNQNFTKTATTDDYLGITGQTLYNFTGQSVRYRRFLVPSSTASSSDVITSFYMPTALYMYKTSNWLEFEDYIRNGNEEKIIQLLEDIKAEEQKISEALTNTDPTSETDSFVSVDTSSTDSISSTAVDNVASNVLSNLENKVNNYNPSTDYSFVWNLMGTTITFHSNMIYNLIKDTFLYDLIQMLWFFVTGHYCFAFLSNLIHSIKDGSILDGFHPNEVISKEVL